MRAPAAGGRIVKGRNATHGHHPWIVMFGYPPECGGSLISEHLGVTAAHCVRYRKFTGVCTYVWAIVRTEF